MYLLQGLSMYPNIFEWDGLFIMLAGHKCLNIFPVLKSVYFPPFSRRQGQLPLSQHVFTEALHWNRTLSRDAGLVTGPNCCVSQLQFFMRKWGCILFARKSPIPPCADQRADKADSSDFLQTSQALEKGNKSVPGPSQNASNPLSLFGKRCLQTRYSI